VIDQLLSAIASALAGVTGVVMSVALLLLLVQRELLRSAGGARARRWTHLLNGAIGVLTLVFAITVVVRLSPSVDNWVAQQAAAPRATPQAPSAPGASAAPSTPGPTAAAVATAAAQARPNAIARPTSRPAATIRPSPTSLVELVYIVQPGDRLLMLAQRFATSVEAIIAHNPGINPDSLVVGDLLRIPALNGGATPPIAMPQEAIYTVQKGDMLFVLAQRFDTSVEAIMARNPGINPDSLVVGDLLRIPAEP
jgi:LysM repeat protein